MSLKIHCVRSNNLVRPPPHIQNTRAPSHQGENSIDERVQTRRDASLYPALQIRHNHTFWLSPEPFQTTFQKTTNKNQYLLVSSSFHIDIFFAKLNSNEWRQTDFATNNVCLCEGKYFLKILHPSEIRNLLISFLFIWSKKLQNEKIW